MASDCAVFITGVGTRVYIYIYIYRKISIADRDAYEFACIHVYYITLFKGTHTSNGLSPGGR